MKSKATDIEVEVLEVDGFAPLLPQPGTAEDAPAPRHWQVEQSWPGPTGRGWIRWWPLWVLLAGVALILLVIVGLVLGGIILITRIFFKIIHALVR